MARLSLDSFWQKPQEEGFPTLNPSRATSSMPTSTPTQPDEPEQPGESFMSKAKDRAIGAAKSVGEGIVQTGEMALGAPKMLAQTVNPLARALPDLKDSKIVQKGLDTAKGFLKPTNETQQQAKDVTDWATLLTPFVGGAVAKAPGYARALEEVSLRLTAAESRELGAKLDRATKFLVDKGIVGNPSERLDKAQMLYEETERRLQDFLTKEAKSVKIPRQIYVARLENLKNKYMDDSESLEVIDQIDRAIKTFKSNYKGTALIPVDRFNKWKRSVMQNAFNKTGLKVRDDVEFAIGEQATEMLEDGLKKLRIDGVDFSDFNSEYADLITARKLLYKAEDRDQISMIGKIITTMLGSSLGGGAGFAAGGGWGASLGVPAGIYVASRAAPLVAGTSVRSRLGGIYAAAEPLVPAAKKALSLAPLALSQIAESLGLVKGAEEFDELKGSKPPRTAPQKEGRKSLESFKE